MPVPSEIIAQIIAGVASVVAAVTAAVFATVQAVRARRASRTDALEVRVANLQEDVQLLYLWNRQLVDHIYRGNPPPPPGPPPGLFSNNHQ